jgi:putative sporulation protein YyaC
LLREGWTGLLSRTWTEPREQRAHVDSPNAGVVLSEAVMQYGTPHVQSADEIIVLCIGTDRSTGDALGPLIGSHLLERNVPGCVVFGTLDDPVHAGNLGDTLQWIQDTYRQPLVIAVDACLGRAESVGMLTVGCGSLRPGAGVHKSLPAVGQVYVTGVVNVGGFMEYLVLQNTRLSLVTRMARVAAQGIAQGLTGLMHMRNGGAFAREGRPLRPR